jgi:PLP dependent protein
MKSLVGKITKIQEEIAPATLLVVTKKRPVSQVLRVIESPVQIIGENRVQEVQRKYTPQLLSALTTNKVELHFIGHLQTNKVNIILNYVSCIQSVDSLKLANAISKECKRRGKPIDVYLQLNLAGEQQKYGFTEQDLMKNWSHLESLPGLTIRGLMCMGKRDEEEETGRIFKKCRELANHLKLGQCSMGMSEDYKIALQEGATIVRIGRRLFENAEIC